MMLTRKLSNGAAVVVVVALCACSRAQEGGAEGAAGTASPDLTATDTAATGTAEGQGAMAEQGAMADTPSTQQPAEGQAAEGMPSGDAAAASEKRPGAVAPAPGVEPSKVKNWMLIEFARPVEDADLAWLRQNGFQVDTLMSPTMVRGWLEKPEGGEVIGTDPRVARIHAQMR